MANESPAVHFFVLADWRTIVHGALILPAAVGPASPRRDPAYSGLDPPPVPATTLSSR